MPATYHPCLPGKWTPSAIEQPDDAYLRVSGPLGPERPVLHHGVPVPRTLTGKSLTAGCTQKGGCLLSAHSAPDQVDCCCRRILYHQRDFVDQCSQLQELIESRSHLCDFYPKYHCELNFIEQYWGAAKAQYRVIP